uniref:Uncharacterized protein LOC104214003 n=1 Tax=Nicotiana sylvestris TaxID=4096 RepID=A0A1U7VJ80_NICSY|nr:PREDICTED: uncharacterized protein LOC104214003 [Nicotiana sylvestris]
MPYCQQQLKDGSAWILVLIFSFRLAHIFDMVEYGLVVEVLVKLLDFPDESLCEKAFLVVGQIAAGDCDCLLDHGALTPLLNKSKEANNNFPMQRKDMRILSLIFKSKPDLPSEQVTSAVYSLFELLRSEYDEVLTNFNPADLGCLVTLLDNHNKDADVVTDICNIMYGIVKHGNMEVGKSELDRVEEIINAIAATINIAIASGNDAHIKYLVDISYIEVLCDFIASCYSEIFMRDNLEKLEKILEFGAPSIDYARRIEKNIKSIHSSSSPRQVPFHFGEFLRKLDKYLGMSKLMDLKDIF